MTYKGVEYSLTAAADASIWHWRFELSGKPISGKTRANLKLLAARKVQQRIDHELRQLRAKDISRADIAPTA